MGAGPEDGETCQWQHRTPHRRLPFHVKTLGCAVTPTSRRQLTEPTDLSILITPDRPGTTLPWS
ncbi:hypothetical protein AB0D38_32735 [Streptomyces sp. NPDC048279]|uniref:hypothetical protein n=1 Tax=Streptomyces sp. NPDC048279 TaxID=3154714 RepID=UPI00342A3637